MEVNFIVTQTLYNINVEAPSRLFLFNHIEYIEKCIIFM